MCRWLKSEFQNQNSKTVLSFPFLTKFWTNIENCQKFFELIQPMFSASYDFLFKSCGKLCPNYSIVQSFLSYELATKCFRSSDFFFTSSWNLIFLTTLEQESWQLLKLYCSYKSNFILFYYYLLFLLIHYKPLILKTP